jgi:glycosyltransferase involved in cell wall biosynthesis
MKQNKKIPFITIIIAIRNVARELKITLDSIEEQTFKNVEVLIPDCNSTDDPAALIKNYSFPIRHVVQSDTGIYDAWNKVLPLATGQWVVFFGAGDSFAEALALEKSVAALEQLPKETIMAYGKVNVLGENGAILGVNGAAWPTALKNIARFDMFPHQATFQRRSSFETYGLFSTTYEIAGDTEMIFRLAEIKEPAHFDVVVSNFRYGGKSSHFKSRKLAIDEMTKLLTAHGIAHRRIAPQIKLSLLRFGSLCLPENAIQFLINSYRVMTGRKRRY